MAASTRERVAGETLEESLITRETVWWETPASRATSPMLAGRGTAVRPPSRAAGHAARPSSPPLLTGHFISVRANVSPWVGPLTPSRGPCPGRAGQGPRRGHAGAPVCPLEGRGGGSRPHPIRAAAQLPILAGPAMVAACSPVLRRDSTFASMSALRVPEAAAGPNLAA